METSGKSFEHSSVSTEESAVGRKTSSGSRQSKSTEEEEEIIVLSAEHLNEQTQTNDEIQVKCGKEKTDKRAECSGYNLALDCIVYF